MKSAHSEALDAWSPRGRWNSMLDMDKRGGFLKFRWEEGGEGGEMLSKVNSP